MISVIGCPKTQQKFKYIDFWPFLWNFPAFKLGLILEIEKSGANLQVYVKETAKFGTYRRSFGLLFTPTHHLYATGRPSVRHWAVELSSYISREA